MRESSNLSKPQGDSMAWRRLKNFWSNTKNSTKYFQLLVSAEPSQWDFVVLVTGLISAVAAGVPFPLLGIIFGQLVDDFNSASCADASVDRKTYQSGVNHKTLLVLYIAVAQFVLMYVYLACWSLTGARLAQRLRHQYLRRLLQQEPSFFDARPSGQISSRLNGDIQTIRAGTSEKVGICISSASFFITAYIVAFIKDWKLAAMLLSLIPAYFAMSLIGNKYIEQYAGTLSDHAAHAASIALEALSHIPVVQSFRANYRLELMFNGHLTSARKDGIKKSIAIGVQAGLMYFIAYAANALAFWQGSRSIAAAVEGTGDASVGKTYTVIFILVDATLVLSQVAPFLQIFSAAVGAANAMQEEMNQILPDKKPSVATEKFPDLNGDIEFADVSFEYPTRTEVPVLKNVSLVFPAGKHTAIIGQSGSGKSTIAQLVTKLYKTTRGRILINNHAVEDINSDHLRKSIGVVEQDPTLFNRSILENIALGLLNLSSASRNHLKPLLISPELQTYVRLLQESEAFGEQSPAPKDAKIAELMEIVQNAATLADAHEFIMRLKHGYGTMLGSKGRVLSGGQKQRLSLARALVRDPEILILDEASSALDSQTEQRVQESLEQLARGKTLITIAHRLSTIKNADNIIVMREGSVIEFGTHAKLMAEKGEYAQLVKTQAFNASPTFNVELSSTKNTASESSIASDIVVTPKSEKQAEHASDEDEDEPVVSSSMSLRNLLKGISQFARKDVSIILAAFIGCVMVGGSFSAESAIFGNTVGQLNTCRLPDDIRASGKFFGLLFFILGVVEFFANIMSWSGFGYFSENLVFTARASCFKTLLAQDLAWHHSSNRSPSSLLSIVTKDGNALAGISGSVIGTILSILINLLAAIILTNVIAWKIALVCLATVPLLLGAGLIQLRTIAKFEEKHENAFSESIDIAIEAVEAIKTVTIFSLQSDTMSRYENALSRPIRETTAVSLKASLWQAMTYFIGNLSYALAFWWGSKQIFAGTYSTAQFLIVIMSLLVSAQLWTQMFALAPELSSARAAIARILNLLQLNDELTSYKSSLPVTLREKESDLEAYVDEQSTFSRSNGGIGVKFRDVVFSYPSRPDAPVIKSLNLDIPAGKFCAFVGPSGAGKSTIISLIERLYTPESGTIEVGGQDITHSRQIAFRDNLALVPQESALFDGSVDFNVSLGARPDHVATNEEVIKACQLANIHQTVMQLPQSYKTECGQNGSLISGGQKQRIAIARALVRQPRLLILDESTSALDAESEKLIQDSLAKVSTNMTVIAVAHRLNTIQRADIIFVIEKGRCMDQGTHEELLLRNEFYRDAALHQMASMT